MAYNEDNMVNNVNIHVSLCVSALNAAELLTVDTTTASVDFTWSLPAGYYDGFHVYGNALSPGAMHCTDTVYGESYTWSCLLLVCLYVLCHR